MTALYYDHINTVMINVERVIVVNFKRVINAINFLGGVEAIAKVSVDYFKVIADVENITVSC